MDKRLERHLAEAASDLATALRFATKHDWNEVRDYLGSAIELVEHALEDVDRLEEPSKEATDG